ncbi:unnamed protein product [Paramecium octaurelia]|uniref:Uncharacterized protein n=1 Tax=Paramecium octaurelia TaxID=43137 RepID=A0A8S1W434_PAROT|nr:unnamed protein product [Paramecium octaurelia]
MLFRKQYYGCEIESWPQGCILAEMALRSPLFSDKTQIKYLFDLFQFLRYWNSISGYVKIKFPLWIDIQSKQKLIEQMKQQTQFKIYRRKITHSQQNIKLG